MSGLVELKKYLERSQAELDASYLKSCHLHPVIMSDDLAGLRPHMSYGYSIRLMIPRNEYEEADDLLHAEDVEYEQPSPQMQSPHNPQNTIQIPPSEAYIQLERAWKFALIGTLLLPFIAHIYSLILLKLSIPNLTEADWEHGARSKIMWIVILDALAFYIFYHLIK